MLSIKVSTDFGREDVVRPPPSPSRRVEVEFYVLAVKTYTHRAPLSHQRLLVHVLFPSASSNKENQENG